jgi:hypothetical protein
MYIDATAREAAISSGIWSSAPQAVHQARMSAADGVASILWMREVFAGCQPHRGQLTPCESRVLADVLESVGEGLPGSLRCGER